MGFRDFWSFSLGSRPGFLAPWAYFRVCVSVAVFLLIEASLYAVSKLFWLRPENGHQMALEWVSGDGFG